MIYWHVEKRATCVYSQLKRCSSLELAPRLKAIARQKLAIPYVVMRTRLPNLLPIFSGTINWEEIEQQYDEMVKYAAAMQTGTADLEAILRRLLGLKSCIRFTGH